MSCIIAIRVTPRAPRPELRGWRAGADGREELEIRVCAAPADGVANDAVISLLADTLGVPRSQVAILSGHASRHKRVTLPLDEKELRRLLDSLVAKRRQERRRN